MAGYTERPLGFQPAMMLTTFLPLAKMGTISP